MAKAKFTAEDDELLAELGVEVEVRRTSAHSARDERVIAGFDEIVRFVKQHERMPEHGEDKDIFERLYAVRLDKLRSSDEFLTLLAELDVHQLLSIPTVLGENNLDDLGDDELLAELGITVENQHDITKLTHVKPRAEKKAAEEIGQNTPCNDFDVFKPLFDSVQADLKSGLRTSRRFKLDAEISKGEFYILFGQIAYVAEMEPLKKDSFGKWDGRLRVIYDNGTESNILLRSLQRALYRDEAGRRITDSNAGPLFDSTSEHLETSSDSEKSALFSDDVEDDDIGSGVIYVLRSQSDLPEIKQNRNLIHKIGVTSGDVVRRIANAKLDPTFLMAEVEVVATYELFHINRTKLEYLLHRFFDSARLNIKINDRFGHPVMPREWFLVPIFIIDEVVARIKDETLGQYQYDLSTAMLVKR
jgi:hypothetical protein